MAYGWVKNLKGFPYLERGEDEKPRFIVKVPEAHDFLDAKEKERAEKKAAKEAAKNAETSTDAGAEAAVAAG